MQIKKVTHSSAIARWERSSRSPASNNWASVNPKVFRQTSRKMLMLSCKNKEIQSLNFSLIVNLENIHDSNYKNYMWIDKKRMIDRFQWHNNLLGVTLYQYVRKSCTFILPFIFLESNCFLTYVYYILTFNSQLVWIS